MPGIPPDNMWPDQKTVNLYGVRRSFKGEKEGIKLAFDSLLGYRVKAELLLCFCNDKMIMRININRQICGRKWDSVGFI